MYFEERKSVMKNDSYLLPWFGRASQGRIILQHVVHYGKFVQIKGIKSYPVYLLNCRWWFFVIGHFLVRRFAHEEFDYTACNNIVMDDKVLLVRFAIQYYLLNIEIGGACIVVE